MKIMIEVRGGRVVNIMATGKADIYLVDHDNIEEKQSVEIAEMMYSPDVVVDEVEFQKQLEDTIVNSL